MKQNLVSLVFSDEDLAAVDAALDALDEKLAGLIALSSDEVRGLFKMGEKSEVFCRTVVDLLGQHPEVVAPALGLGEAIADLTALDALRPRVRRLQILAGKGLDTQLALGADVMSVAREGYALLRVSGHASGLDDQRRTLSARFRRSRRKEPASVA